MGISRRQFIYRTGTLAAGGSLIPSVTISSCKPSGKAGQVRMGFIGTAEHFRYYRPVFQKLKRATVEMISLENAMKSDLHALFLDAQPSTKAVNIMLLFEERKDVVTTYPLAGSLAEYRRIQENMAHYERKLGMMNPLYYYPALNTLKKWLNEGIREFNQIRVSCHPKQLVRGYVVNGFAGAVQPLQRMISFMTGKFPISLLIEDDQKQDLRRYILDYVSFEAIIQTDPEQTGWIMELKGPQLNAVADHTGLLKLNNEVEPRIYPTTSVWNKAMILNMEDFLQAVRSRVEPAVNSLDGLAAIILNRAAEESLHQGSRVDL